MKSPLWIWKSCVEKSKQIKTGEKNQLTPIQPKTKELLPEIREETASYEPEDSTSVKAVTEEADVKVQHEDTDKTEVLPAAHTGRRHTQKL